MTSESEKEGSGRKKEERRYPQVVRHGRLPTRGEEIEEEKIRSVGKGGCLEKVQTSTEQDTKSRLSIIIRTQWFDSLW